MDLPVYHRVTSSFPNEELQVRTGGYLWGKAPRQVAGNGPACLKAYVGPLPDGTLGYSCVCELAPTRQRNFVGKRGAVWDDGTPGVEEVPGHPDFVRIAVRVLDA